MGTIIIAILQMMDLRITEGKWLSENTGRTQLSWELSPSRLAPELSAQYVISAQ